MYLILISVLFLFLNLRRFRTEAFQDSKTTYLPQSGIFTRHRQVPKFHTRIHHFDPHYQRNLAPRVMRPFWEHRVLPLKNRNLTI
jgi:hypothetical protein